MRLLSSPSEIASAFTELLRKCESVSFAVAWASCGFESCDRLLKSRGKITRGVVGTHFYQTDPEFIEAFHGNKNVKFNMNPSGVFHPKVYLFESKEGQWDCLIGSANFTAAGFGENSELLVHIERQDHGAAALCQEVQWQIDAYWDLSTAQFADAIDLERYRYWKDRFRRPVERAQGRFGVKRARKSVEDVPFLNLSWPEFFARVRRDRHHGWESRIAVLAAARDLFTTHSSLAEMPLADRQGIAGFGSSEDTPWGWFGSMKGAGVFKNLINEQPEELSAALDEIPPQGPVQRDDYLAFLERYLAAFPKRRGQPFRHGLGTASRLLAMKRPDYFMCVDKANKADLSKALDLSLGHHDYEAYWDSVVERICEAPWWNARRPRSGNESAVWDGRTAFLDAIFYAPV